ncbi:hypothetical protein [Actinobaculum sp. 313]|uniref:hypothetical protein n=1 Tax=Actinobaculum sp. 313 TaxID=2495645 RepID=UPI000D525B94|nr:hypothetical protein [Actinobaculum sp. 313]AWE41817.1 hypothetical protein DDD63_02510 [Actinobaculum sp. 313]
MGDIRLDVDQMADLRKRLLKIADNLHLETFPYVPDVGLGFPSLFDSAITFGLAHTERRSRAISWCEDTADAVDYTAKFVGQTDDDVAHDWAQSDSGASWQAMALLLGGEVTGTSVWSQIFTGNDHRAH